MATAVCVGLVLAVAAVFGRTVTYDFVNFDDDQYVYENPYSLGGLTAEALAWPWSHACAGNWHPLTMLSHALDCQLYGRWAGGHHLTNVLLHAANSVLLFLLLRQMTAALWPSALVAGVFAVHPLHVESVAWIAERKDVLSGLFFLLTVAAYVRYARRPFSLPRYAMVAVPLTLGLMCKPMLVTLPFVLLLLDYWPLERFGRRKTASAMEDLSEPMSSSWVRLIGEKVPLVLLSAASCAATLAVQQNGVASIDNMPLLSRLSNALISYAAYIGQMFYPVGLAVFYPLSRNGVPTGAVIGAVMLLSAVTLVACVWRKRHPYLLVGWLWYLGMLVPVSGLIQVGEQAMADRYTYLPQIGLSIAVVWYAASWVPLWRFGRAVGAASAVAAMVALLLCAGRQTSYWRNSEALFARALECTSDNWLAHSQLGVALAAGGQFDEAMAHYRRCLELKPEDAAKAYTNIGNILYRRGQMNEAIAEYNEALKLKPESAEAHMNLGLALTAKGQLDEALSHLQESLRIDPELAEAYTNVGNILARRGRMNEAVTEYEKALRLKPQLAEAHMNVGSVLAAMGYVDDATAHWYTVLQLKPDNLDARNYLATFLNQQGNVAGAITQWEEILRAQPDQVRTLNLLAWVRATSPEPSIRNGAKAVALAQRAVQLSGGEEPAILDTLAAAYAEAGQFGEAAATAERALKLASAQGKDALADALRARIKLYQTGRAFHEL